MLLEREREMSALDRLLDEVAGGQPAVAVIEGPAGVGKSRLLLEARRRANDNGLHVFCARRSELETENPFGTVRQLFEPEVMPGGERAFPGCGRCGPGDRRQAA